MRQVSSERSWRRLSTQGYESRGFFLLDLHDNADLVRRCKELSAAIRAALPSSEGAPVFNTVLVEEQDNAPDLRDLLADPGRFQLTTSTLQADYPELLRACEDIIAEIAGFIHAALGVIIEGAETGSASAAASAGSGPRGKGDASGNSDDNPFIASASASASASTSATARSRPYSYAAADRDRDRDPDSSPGRGQGSKSGSNSGCNSGIVSGNCNGRGRGLRRVNSTGTIYINHTMAQQDDRLAIRCVSLVIRAHMIEAMSVSQSVCLSAHPLVLAWLSFLLVFPLLSFPFLSFPFLSFPFLSLPCTLLAPV